MHPSPAICNRIVFAPTSPRAYACHDAPCTRIDHEITAPMSARVARCLTCPASSRSHNPPRKSLAPRCISPCRASCCRGMIPRKFDRPAYFRGLGGLFSVGFTPKICFLFRVAVKCLLARAGKRWEKSVFFFFPCADRDIQASRK